MPLTPPDVAAKQFRVAFRGYAIDEVDAFLEEVESELGRLITQATVHGAAADASTADLEGQEAALRTLQLAQRTADEAVAEARVEAERLLSSAREEAAQTLAAARSEAEATLSASREEAAGLDAALEARRQEALGQIEAHRRQLEARIEELRAFEREYRTRLRAYLQGQLRELDSRSGPDDGGAGVPALAGRTAAGDDAARTAPPADH